MMKDTPPSPRPLTALVPYERKAWMWCTGFRRKAVFSLSFLLFNLHPSYWVVGTFNFFYVFPNIWRVFGVVILILIPISNMNQIQEELEQYSIQQKEVERTVFLVQWYKIAQREKQQLKGSNKQTADEVVFFYIFPANRAFSFSPTATSY